MGKVDYKNTLNLPRTEFGMKAKLYENEPKMVERWDRDKVYEAVLAAHQADPRWVLHDGPPYANGNIHLGTAMNKILKDMVVKSATMAGHLSPYVPGWDCHGLPIEHQVDLELGKDKDAVPADRKRKLCRDYAARFIEVQRQEFKRMLVLGEWQNPYVTMDFRYEANIAREFGKFVAAGSVYRADKPVWWCPYHKTALAEAELEYSAQVSPSIYVRFPWQAEKSPDNATTAELKKIAAAHGPVFLVIWTTTPWTIPGNLAIALHPDFDYVAAAWQGAVYILAEGLANHAFAAAGMEGIKAVGRFPGRELEGQVARHPLYDRDSKVVLADYVTLEAGTGCVHTAPGHGRDDYETGMKYGLPVYSPVDEEGKFTADVEFFAGQFVFDANPKVVAKLKEVGHLLHAADFEHDYPNCWRNHPRPGGKFGKEPVIARATPQWFISMEKNGLREKALAEIKKVRWDPEWGQERIYGMIESRPDWCISRQRVWGVPIVAFHCRKCGEVLLDAGVISHVADIFEREGADAWYTRSADDLLPEDKKRCQCGARDFEKDNAILDVWFDSGVSFACVCEDRKLGDPCDMYLEGSDQHRGWFHSSLLCSVGTRGKAPFKVVLTHGYTVDAEGKKYSKSSGNYIPMDELLKDFGAEVLRMWTASENFRNDVRVSKEIMSGIGQSYRKVRNTLRYMLSNLYDFDPKRDLLPVAELLPLDRWMLHRVEENKRRWLEAYKKWEFHVIYHGLTQLCTVDLSALYFDLVRDRLYCEAATGKKRRGAQTAIYLALEEIVRLMAPILAFTAEEVYDHLPGRDPAVKSVHCLNFPAPREEWLAPEEEAWMTSVLALQEAVNRQLDPKQKEKVIGHPNDAEVTLLASAQRAAALRELNERAGAGEDLSRLMRVSVVKIAERPESELAPLLARQTMEGQTPPEFVEVNKAPGGKCQRCWFYSEELTDEVCPRCAKVMATGK
jgi:isoleucyl-tRNA synthetase